MFVLSEVPFIKLGCEECFYETVPKNVEAVVRKCSSEAVAQRSSVIKVLLEILQNLLENTCAKASLLIKLQANVGNFIYKETLAQVFPVNFAKFLKTSFLTEHLWWLLLVLQNRCSYKFPDIHQKIFVLKSLFNTVRGQKAHYFNMCFPVNIIKYLRIAVL